MPTDDVEKARARQAIKDELYEEYQDAFERMGHFLRMSFADLKHRGYHTTEEAVVDAYRRSSKKIQALQLKGSTL